MTTAIVLAGGLGTRLRTVVSDVPKPMAPIKEKPFLVWLMDYWIKQGVDHFILAVSYKHEVIINYFGNKYKNAELEYSIETTPLGTGGALLQALQKVSANEFLLLNGDTYFMVDFAMLQKFAHKNTADWCFSLFTSDDHNRYLGIDIQPTGQITALNSTKNSMLVNGGVYLLKTAAINMLNLPKDQQISLEQDILPLALNAHQKMYGMSINAPFIDIGIPKDYYQSAEII